MNPKELQSDGNGGHIWTGSNEKFQGYTARALQDVDKTLKEIKETNEKQWELISDNKSRLDVIKGQAMTRAMFVSAGVSILLLLIAWVGTNIDKIMKAFGG